VAQEIDGFKILAAAEAIGNPLPLAARVVAIEQRCHRVDSQPIDVKTLEPENCRRYQEGVHLAPAEIVNRGIPFLVKAFAWIRMLVERVPSKYASPCGSVGKCPGTQSRITPIPAL